MCLVCPVLCLGQQLTTSLSNGVGHEQPTSKILKESKQVDIGRKSYYKNRLEFSLETGWLPVNIPFVFDCFLGGGYNVTGLEYTLVPTIASLRWQMGDVRGPWILRGNWDLTFSGAFIAIPRGPETHYLAYDMGLRRNFVRRTWKASPYFEYRLGMGRINAKGPKGVAYAQGQDFTFTMMMGTGVRYNFNSRYAISTGLTWMHVSNLYLSEPNYLNYGINVVGPIIGLDVRLGKARTTVASN